MKRFNQYINGERDFKTTVDQINILDEAKIKKENQEKQYNNYINNLADERKELRDLIFKGIFHRGFFIDEGMDEEQKYEIRNNMMIENFDLGNAEDNKAYYECDLVDKIMDTTEPIMDKIDYIQTCIFLLKQNLEFDQSSEF
eukprot:CAMPEP_0205802022 /NCGR_PEP_ID=MMETSP0205-20121125/4203_1 /ASSEMBLY_ACC=CAM_ASM_000278 /TAXON_ID=36767 /ORGANISM="Euplotes focardii, Strain TN1" /LENGTH=141 /DNA_ID=CAMNT_0053067739 /DNA_START=249 /DNA_END=675 /DNA_ORIENTATION=+